MQIQQVQQQHKNQKTKTKKYDDEVFTALVKRKLFHYKNDNYRTILKNFKCTNCQKQGHINIICTEHQKPTNVKKYKETIFKQFCDKIPEKSSLKFEEIFEIGNSLN